MRSRYSAFQRSTVAASSFSYTARRKGVSASTSSWVLASPGVQPARMPAATKLAASGEDAFSAASLRSRASSSS